MDKSYFDFDENLIKVTKYEVLGKLPDPFLKESGERVKSPLEWSERRKEIYKTAVELQYGTQPPKPEFFIVKKIYENNYRITAGTKDRQLSFTFRVFLPEKAEGKVPVVVDGDMCFPYPWGSAYREEFLSKNIAYVVFNRVELADDIQFVGRRGGPLYEIYPDYTFGALGAWAWGYMRVVDALEQMDLFDLDYLAFTGHSRGGKTAMLAGVLDERAKIVNPNETNQGSCSCYRVHSEIRMENGKLHRSETLNDLWNNYGFWIGEGMGEYATKEAELPFDAHFLKAMVAPRVLLVGEAASDGWTNVPGTWQTSKAALEVFKFLGCEDNLKWYFRKGYHNHAPEDAGMLANLICHLQGKEELYPYYYKIPFKSYEKIWDWTVPEK